jgi:hypothetical protein
MLEAPTKSDVFEAANSRPDTRLFRNNVGLGWCGKLISKTVNTVLLKFPRPVKFGLHIGSGDLIGWTRIKITPDYIGREVAVFTSIETKSTTGKLREEQANWHNQVIQAGGISGIARSAKDFFDIVSIFKL